MDKFTNFQDNTNKENKAEIVFKSDNSINVVKYNDWFIVDEQDMIIVLPYLKDEGCILLRYEYIPTYQLKHKDKTNFITVIAGRMEKGEKPEETVRRELYEEAGIVLSNIKEIKIDEPLQVSKGNLARYYCCILELGSGEYKQSVAIGDGSFAEKYSKTIKVPIRDLDTIKKFDLITDYMIQKVKTEFDLK